MKQKLFYFTLAFLLSMSVMAATPGTPSSPSPSSGATNVATSGTFSWTSANAVSYDLYIGESSSNMTLYKSGSGKSCSYSGLAEGTKYYWKVVVYSSTGGSAQSSKWTFTTKVATPGIPSSPSPSSGATDVATSGTFSWTSANAVSYDLYIGESSSSMTLYKSGSGKSCSYSGLDEETKYYWKVVVYSSTGGSAQSGKWTFTTKAGSTAPDLSVSSSTYFGSSTLEYGQTYNYTATVKNNGSTAWTGKFILKPVGTMNKDWLITSEKTIAAGETRTIQFPYTAKCTGDNINVALYYLTSGESSGDMVKAGNCKNPFSVTVKEAKSSVPTPDYAQLTYSNVTSTGFNAYWISVSGATRYDVRVFEASATSDDNYVQQAGFRTTWGQIDGLTPGKQYQFKVRAEINGVFSNWSQRNTDIITLNSASAQTAGLKLVSGGTSGTEITLGSVYSYSVIVKNTDPQNAWSGTFVLRDGTNFVCEWEKSIDGNSARMLDFDYQPKQAGTSTLSLYYKTGKIGAEVLVPCGDYSNPITVKVTQQASIYNGLYMNGDLTADKTSVDVGSPCVITAKVKNTGSESWSGCLYLTDNGEVISTTSCSLAAGGVKTTYLTDYAPQTAGIHIIEACWGYSSAPSVKYALNAGSYENSIVITVTTPVVENKATSAVFRHLTKDVVPTAVNQGSLVLYHFLVQDEDGKPIPDVKAVFSRSDGYACLTDITSPASDAEGIISMAISADPDNNAIVTAGQMIELSLGKLVRSDTYEELTIASGKSEGSVTLKVNELNNLGTLVKRLDIDASVGASGKFSLRKLAELEAGINHGLGVGLKWGGDNKLSEVNVEADNTADFKGSLNFGTRFIIEDEAEIGVHENTIYNCKVPWKTTVMALYNLFVGSQTSSNTMCTLGIIALEDWLNDHIETLNLSDAVSGIEENIYLQNTVKGEFKLKGISIPASAKGFLPVPAIPSFVWNNENAKINGSASFKWDLLSMETEVGSDHKIYASSYNDSRSLSFSATGQFASKVLDIMFFPTTLFLLHDYRWSSAGAAALTSFKSNANSEGTGKVTFREEEKYYDKAMTQMKSISSATSYTFTEGVSIEDPFGLADGKISASYSNTFTNRYTSSGSFAKYLLEYISKGDAEKDAVGEIYPQAYHKSVTATPFQHLQSWKRNINDCMQNLNIDYSRYNMKDVLEYTSDVKSKYAFEAKIPVIEYGIVKISLNGSFGVTTQNYPSEYYYCADAKRMLPVHIAPTVKLEDLMNDACTRILNSFKNMLTDSQKEELNEKAEEISAGKRFNLDSHQLTRISNLGERTSSSSAATQRLRRLRPKVAAARCGDISELAIVVDCDRTSFDENTELGFRHFYPGGELFVVTADGDTLIALSEVIDVSAVSDGDTLKIAPNGSFMLETMVGKDDLVPFGMSENTPLDVYHSEFDGDVWTYVGPAGTALSIDSMGSYVLATSLRNDVVAPELTAHVNWNGHLLQLKAEDNIALKTGSIRVIVNGTERAATHVSAQEFEISLEENDVHDQLMVYADIYDLAGNRGHLFQIFEDPAPTSVRVVSENEDLAQVSINRKQLTVSRTTPGGMVALYNLDGEVVAKKQADNQGYVHIPLGYIPAGIYLVNLPDGITRKYNIK